MAFCLRHGSGIVCAPMSDERANQLGRPVDSRDYGIGAAILVGLSVRRLRLITDTHTSTAGCPAMTSTSSRGSAPPPR
jgi:3,4-dihydroxy-2-butanone 4-phosphate synthase